MGEISLIVVTVFAFVGWALFFGTYIKYRDMMPYRTLKIPIGYRFAILPLEEVNGPGVGSEESAQERPHVQ